MSTEPTAELNDPKERDALPQLMKAFKNVDEKAPDAALNKTSITDNKGGRIELDDKTAKDNTVIRGVENLPDTVHGVES